ncbi:class I lanthipeptide [Tenacibaculum sp. 1B UA]|uniref:class I lanthipeptide n=1 Tax=Tenacibaculum sp. 1B UA TaxID=2922252 RepID=UPI002A24555D|nr:class I lanthipeptide [Tenacibaculum sp. 1B UA]MDX8553575.1 class I lanthipeptide [Tenacibaculum sp. 1B UA]
MKKITLNKGLRLNKEAITKLQDSQMSSFKGGINAAAGATCANGSCIKSCNEDSCIGGADQVIH